MNRRKVTAILMALALSATVASVSGCKGRTVYINGEPSQEVTESSVAESSVEESSEVAESSVEESSEVAESSVEESSEAESSVEESSEAESSVEESSEAESSAEQAETVVTFQKPEQWNDTINAYIYEDGGVGKNAEWPGEAMTDNGDGTYSYTVPSEIGNPKIIFNDGKNQYPGSLEPGLDIESGKTYTIE